MPSAEFYFARHGEAEHNTAGVASAHPEEKPYNLTEKGKEMAQRAADKIRELGGVDLIFSSDLARTRQTAEIIAASLGKKEVMFDPRLRDINVGVWNNKPLSEMHQVWPQEVQFHTPAEGGESGADVKARMVDFVQEIAAKHPGKRILVISHGDPIWLIKQHFGIEGPAHTDYATPIRIDVET